ncbi:MAG: ATP-binding protein [Ktedonobacteraceae bacterium]
MQQSGQQTVQQVQWMFWGASEEAIDRDFYVSLQGMVANYIKAGLRTGETVQVGREMHLQVGSYIIHTRLTNIAPPLATRIDPSTLFVARYREPSKEGQDISTFISEVIRYPDDKYGAIYDSLVGIDRIKQDMERKLEFLLRPDAIEQWLLNTYGNEVSPTLLQTLRDRYPLIILEGEVGSGKTALARSIGHVLVERLQAAQVASQLALFVVSAQVRGGGHVGELTQNISRSFDEAERCQEREHIPILLLIDEADSLAQARGSTQTHHEDDAGVNTLIQRIDRLRGRPFGVIFSTNLFGSLDSAILRRASSVFHFDRPTYEERKDAFQRLLQDLAPNKEDVNWLAALTNPRGLPGSEGQHRYTYSDISQRLIPAAFEMAVAEIEQGHVKFWDYFRKARTVVFPTREYKVYRQIPDEFYDPEYKERLEKSRKKRIAVDNGVTNPNVIQTEEAGR